MGCDIHMMIEYVRWTAPDGTPIMDSFGGRLNPGRNYTMFGIIAGVRADGQLFPQKGLPDDMGWDALNTFHLRIDDDLADTTDGYTSLEKARQWASTSGSKIYHDKNGKPVRVDDPDLHSHTWLTREEFAACVAHYEMSRAGEPLGASWHAILAIMTTFEERDQQTRLLIAFDN